MKGLFIWCQGCSHGGHLGHIKEWFGVNKQCPTGCGHFCEFTWPNCYRVFLVVTNTGWSPLTPSILRFSHMIFYDKVWSCDITRGGGQLMSNSPPSLFVYLIQCYRVWSNDIQVWLYDRVLWNVVMWFTARCEFVWPSLQIIVTNKCYLQCNTIFCKFMCSM